MNVLKKVKEFLGTKEQLESFGIVNAASKLQQEKMALFSNVLKNPGKLSLANVISGEIARLVCLEFRSDIKGSDRAEYLSKQYKRLLPRLREITETAAGRGGVILKPYVSASGIDVTCVTTDTFVPTEISPEGRILGGAFIDRVMRDGRVYTRVECHGFSGSEYIIENKCFVSDRIGNCGKEIPLSLVKEWRKIKSRVAISGLAQPLFAYFKIPSCTDDLPLGEAVFSRSVKLIEDAEKQYRRLLWEFESSERALYVDEAAIRQNDEGKKSLPEKRLYRLINQENLFSDWTPEIREGAILNGLDEILRRIEFNSGIAYGTLSRVQTSDKTAEEIRSSKQRSYAKVSEIQRALKDALEDLVSAMNALCDLYKLSEKGEYHMYFEFDDSIVADRNREFDERLALVDAGIITKEEMRNWYFGNNG